MKSRGIEWWHQGDKIGYGPIYYPIDKSDLVSSSHSKFLDQRLKEWLDYSGRNEASSIIIGDFNHTDGCAQFPDKFCLFKGFGLTLNGSIVRKRATGEIHSVEWWEQ